MFDLEKLKTRAANRRASALASERRAFIRSLPGKGLLPPRVKEAIARETEPTSKAKLQTLKEKVIERDVRAEI